MTVYRGVREQKKADAESLAQLDKLTKWVEKNVLPVFGEISVANFETYGPQADKGILWLCLAPTDTIREKSVELADEMVKGAEGSPYPFVWIDTVQYGEHAKDDLGCTEFPTVVLQKGDFTTDDEAMPDVYKKSFAGEEPNMTGKAIKAWLQDVEDGKVAANA